MSRQSLQRAAILASWHAALAEAKASGIVSINRASLGGLLLTLHGGDISKSLAALDDVAALLGAIRDEEAAEHEALIARRTG